MCLIAIAHQSSETYPLVIAANRDEDHQRPTLDAHWWSDAPGVLGGKDALQGGAWLAMTRGGRFAAVTNLRGAEPRRLSRGFLVRDFVITDVAPGAYAQRVIQSAGDYSGFHLLAGVAGGECVHVTGASRRKLEPGVYAISNAPPGEVWPKTTAAVESLESAMHSRDRTQLVDRLMQILSAPNGSGTADSEIFVRGDRYGTRSSTVIVATAESVEFVEQSFGPGGVRLGARKRFLFDL